jgi:hypothetical protein
MASTTAPTRTATRTRRPPDDDEEIEADVGARADMMIPI